MSAIPSPDSAFRLHRCCPQCGGRLNRTWRRPIDRFISSFAPMQRFTCESFHCRWEGNQRIDPEDLVSHKAEAEALASATRRSEGGLPWSFVVCTSVALAGVVVILALSFDPAFR